jgi:UDP-2-acetamido-3-amino-2,3-dideoxy-glucuronate N-acetyltransferase
MVGGDPQRLELPSLADSRGELVVAEVGRELPFVPRRFFCISGVPAGETRGNHAHRAQTQLLVCLSGSCEVELDDGAASRRMILRGPRQSVLVPPLVWTVQGAFSPDAVLLVVASHSYEPADYIRDRGVFEQVARRHHLVAAEER